MSWKEKRLITILSTILLILTMALLVVLGMRYKENRAKQEQSGTDAETGAVIDQSAYTGLTYDNGSATLSFSRDEDGVWYWTADEDFPLDDSVICDILDLLTNWAPQQVLTDSSALENSGMDEPAASLTASTAAGTETTLLFGRTTTDGNSYYVRRDGDETTVYIIADTLYQLMEIPVYDMCRLPDLPVLEESRIRSITLCGPDGEDGEPGRVTTLTAQQAEGDTAVTWRSEGANVTDAPLVRSLLEDLTALAFDKCVDYNPAEEAASICGFDAPAATLEIAYVTESGSEETLTLTIGNRLLDSSGRYTRLGDDSTIYLLVTDLLDPLMRVAADGLDG